MCVIYGCESNGTCRDLKYCECNEVYHMREEDLTVEDFEMCSFDRLWDFAFADSYYSNTIQGQIKRDRNMREFVLCLLKNPHKTGADIKRALIARYPRWTNLRYLECIPQGMKNSFITHGDDLTYDDIVEHFEEMLSQMKEDTYSELQNIRYRRRIKQLLETIDDEDELEYLIKLIQRSGNVSLYNYIISYLRKRGYNFDSREELIHGENLSDKRYENEYGNSLDIAAGKNAGNRVNSKGAFSVTGGEEEELIELSVLNKLMDSYSKHHASSNISEKYGKNHANDNDNEKNIEQINSFDGGWKSGGSTTQNVQIFDPMTDHKKGAMNRGTLTSNTGSSVATEASPVMIGDINTVKSEKLELPRVASGVEVENHSKMEVMPAKAETNDLSATEVLSTMSEDMNAVKLEKLELPRAASAAVEDENYSQTNVIPAKAKTNETKAGKSKKNKTVSVTTEEEKKTGHKNNSMNVETLVTSKMDSGIDRNKYMKTTSEFETNAINPKNLETQRTGNSAAEMVGYEINTGEQSITLENINNPVTNGNQDVLKQIQMSANSDSSNTAGNYEYETNVENLPEVKRRQSENLSELTNNNNGSRLKTQKTYEANIDDNFKSTVNVISSRKRKSSTVEESNIESEIDNTFGAQSTSGGQSFSVSNKSSKCKNSQAYSETDGGATSKSKKKKNGVYVVVVDNNGSIVHTSNVGKDHTDEFLKNNKIKLGNKNQVLKTTKLEN